MKALFLALVFLFCLGNMAEAQERTVPLQKGGTVWQILKEQGCSTIEISNLWPLVVKDSGLEPENHRHFTVGQLITVKRDCAGQVNTKPVAVAPSADVEGLKARIRSLEKQVTDGQALVSKVQARNSELENSNSPRTWQIVSGLFALLFVGVVAVSAGLLSKKKTAMPAPMVPADPDPDMVRLSPDDLIFPKRVEVEHWGARYTFERRVEPAHNTIQYKCPVDGCKGGVFYPNNAEDHMRRAHEDLGRHTHAWDFTSEEAPARQNA